MISRAEYLQECQKVALKYCDNGQPLEGLTSMFSDLEKHPETAGHKGIDIGMGLLMIGALSSEKDARRFIEGFN